MSSRRNFFKTTSLIVAGGLVGNQMVSGVNLVFHATKINRGRSEKQIAEIIETKGICKEPGIYLGLKSEYGNNAHGHPIIKKRVLEGDRYLGWPTVAKMDNGELVVAFSGDRDAHIYPWGKTQIIRSYDQGKTWSESKTINNTPLDDLDAGLIQTKKGTLMCLGKR